MECQKERHADVILYIVMVRSWEKKEKEKKISRKGSSLRQKEARGIDRCENKRRE